MAKTYLAKDSNNHSVQALSPVTIQNVTTATGASAATATALAKDTVVVRLMATTDTYVAIGTGTPSATSSSMYLPALVPEYFRVDASQTLKVAGLAVTAAGVLNVTEMN
jgi:hypothetical protein